MTTAAAMAKATVVCDDGHRHVLYRFDVDGLKPDEVSRIERALGVDVCTRLSRQMVAIVPATPEAVASETFAVESANPSTAVASATRPTAARPSQPPAATPKPACSESGSCYGDTSEATGKPKTVYVPGYYRKDGTYVRGYYRSK